MSEMLPTFQVRKEINVLNGQAPEFTDADLILTCDRVLERFSESLGHLYQRWLSESKYEPIENYAALVQRLLRLVDPTFTVVGTCRRPFMFHTIIRGYRITFKVTQDYVSYQPTR